MESIMSSYFTLTISNLRQCLGYAADNIADSEDIERWISITNSAIESLEHSIESDSNLNAAEKHKYQNFLAHLITIRNKFYQFIKVGTGLTVENVQSVKWEEIKSAFQKRILSGIIVNLQHLDVGLFMDDALPVFKEKISQCLKVHNSLKVNTELAAEYITLSINAEETSSIKYFNTKSAAIFKTTNLDKWFNTNVRDPILRDIEEFQEEGSGWSLKEILNLGIHINKFNPMRGSSYIKLPKFIANKKACINIQNFNDDRCFEYSILAGLHIIKQHPERVLNYKKFENELNFKDISFPVMPSKIRKFEKQNNVSVNLYILIKNQSNTFDVQPCHLTSLEKLAHVNLLLIQEENSYVIDDSEDNFGSLEDQDDGQYVPPKFHYVLIKDLSRLVRSQISNHDHGIYICNRCLHFFHTLSILEKHKVDCILINHCKIKLPSEKQNQLKFKNYKNKEWCQFIIYADMECILRPVEEEHLKEYQIHEAFSVGLYLKCGFDNSQSEYRYYRKLEDKNQSPAEWFAQTLLDLSIKIAQFFDNPKPMTPLTREQERAYQEAKTCHICEEVFTEQDVKHRDHNHFTGEYRGPAHDRCNINYKDTRMVPVVFHNLSGYDSHLFIREIVNGFPGRVTALPQTKERYISFTKFVEKTKLSFRFIDSFKFMASSLDKLASYLPDFPILEEVFKRDDGYTDDQIDLLKKKGVFPYEYVSSLDKLKETSLPPKADFYNSLTDSEISTEEYERANRVWHDLGIKTLGHYSDVYLKTDIMLLTQVFENFRKTCFETYKLDAALYYTLSGYTWDAMLLYTMIILYLITNIDILNILEKAIRGGVSQCCNRYAKANNKYMKEGYDGSKADSYIMYYDINNLYGWSMSQSLPTGNFEWIQNIDEKGDFYNVPDDNEIGYILEVDLEYPKDIHFDHKDLPLCPDHVCAPGSKQKKLMTTLTDKERYVLHYRNLKQCLSYGMRLKKIHRALSFKQSAWLKKYIDLNTEKRRNAKNEFEKQQFKLMNNAIFGKTMESQRKRINVKFVNKWNGRYGAESYISRPNFHSRSIFTENFIAVQLAKTEIVIDKPIYVGFCILDISKTLVYRFHYEYMSNRFKNQCKILYTDTDSLLYEIKHHDVYEIMKKDIHEFDTYNYPKDNIFAMPRPQENNKKPGLMSDEVEGHIILEFVGLRAKLYSIKIQGKKTVKRGKGIIKSVLDKTITFEDYLRCLYEHCILFREQRHIRSRLHVLRTEKQNKIALSPNDDKRYLILGETDTNP